MYKEFSRRKLPHIQPAGSILFVTFRLAGSIPEWKLAQFRAQKLGALNTSKPKTIEQRRAEFMKYDNFLDKFSGGADWLKAPAIAKVIADSLLYRDGKEFDLHAYTIMPNHVHCVFVPMNLNGTPIPLTKIMHGLKRYSAVRANKLLGRSGEFWAREHYDHVIRNEESWQRVIAYVLNNPVKAGLSTTWDEWPWSYFKYR